VKDKTLETQGSTKEKAFGTTEVAKERLGFTLQTSKIRHETTKFVKEKASKTATITKESLTSHAHHVKIQNKYNTNLDVYLIFGFFCIAK